MQDGRLNPQTVQANVESGPFGGFTLPVIGFVCGAFDCLHPGHILMFRDAKTQCDVLVIGLHADPSVERPDKNKPVQTVEERRIVLSAIRYADDIRVYETEDDLARMLYELKPDVRILGEDWRGKPITAPDAAKRIYWHKRDHGWSSSSMRTRIWKAEQDSINARMRKAMETVDRSPREENAHAPDY